MGAQRAAQLVEAGLWLQMSGDVDGAKRLFEQALKIDPANARAKELLDSMQASVRAAPEAVSAVAMPAELARIATPPKVPAVDPFRVPEALADTAPDPAEDVDIAIELPGPVQEPPGAPVVRPIRFAPNATSAWDSQSNPGVHLKDVNPGLGDAMDLVDDPAPPANAPMPQEPEKEALAADDGLREEVDTLLQGARDLLELDDHSGAMELIVKAQQLSPNDPNVQAMRERSEKTLQTMFESRLGPMTNRPRVVLKDDEIIWLNLDHRAGFVLAQIDGTVSFEDLFEVCGMSRLDTARILAQLVDEGVITLG